MIRRVMSIFMVAVAVSMLMLPSSVAAKNSTRKTSTQIGMDVYSNVGLYTEEVSQGNWKINMPPSSGGLWPASSHIISKDTYDYTELSFKACFLSDMPSTFDYDEFAVFGASDIRSWTGYEVGIRNSFLSNKIIAFVHSPGGGYSMLLMYNDRLWHTYKIQINGTTVTYIIDDVIMGIIDQGLNFNGIQYSIVALGHRFTDGWYNNESMMIKDIKVKY